MRIAILVTNYGPYHLSRINSFQSTCSKINWNLLGIELAREELEYPWKIQTEESQCNIISVINEQALENTTFVQLFLKLLAVFKKTNPDVLAISGYAHPAMLGALLWSRLYRKPAILFSETTERDFPRVGWREKFKGWLVNKYQAALVGGQPHKRYLQKLGMPEEAIFEGYDVVGNSVFHPNRIKHLPCPQQAPFFLAINRFVHKKNLIFLLRAYAAYRKQALHEAWDLVLCGDGQLRPQIEELITELGLKSCVHLPGFLQQDGLLPYFAHASCFVHASVQEQWGLVVNEAMAAGLPVLVSNRCGCFEDLVLEGINGFGFDPENTEELTQLMLKISSGNIDLNAMSQASLQHIQNFSPDFFAQGLTKAVKYVLAQREVKA